MLGTRTTRTIATAAIACSLFAGGVAATPASAATLNEGQFLASLKTEWNKSPAATQITTCKGYKLDAAQVVGLSVSQLWSTPAIRTVITKPALRRVITKYLKWACSGPGTTPR
jgi:hypothetical protein